MTLKLVRNGLHWARRARDVLRTEGIGPVVSKLIARLRLMVGIPDAGQRAFLSRKAQIDLTFDGEMGTDTGGIQNIPSLTVTSANAHFGVDHIACDPAEFEPAIAAIDFPLQLATFLDLGAGKGRALLLAARYPFARIIGVEFAEELQAIAVGNIARAGGDPRVSVLHGDAAQVEYPDGPLVIFMFNPFDGPIVRRVAANALSSFRTDRRPMRIIYLNPRCADDVRDAGWTVTVQGDNFLIFEPAA